MQTVLDASFDRSIQGTSAAHRYRIAVVDDSLDDYVLLKFLLERSMIWLDAIAQYGSIDELMATGTPTPDVIILDRCLPDCELSEARIREIRARHNNCGVILHTGDTTPSACTSAAHEGAVAIIEKGSVDTVALSAIVAAAAQIGPSLRLQ